MTHVVGPVRSPWGRHMENTPRAQPRTRGPPGAQQFLGCHLLLGFPAPLPPAGSSSDHIPCWPLFPDSPALPAVPRHRSQSSPGDSLRPSVASPRAGPGLSLLCAQNLSSGPETQLQIHSLTCAAAKDPESQSLARTQTQIPACKAGCVQGCQRGLNKAQQSKLPRESALSTSEQECWLCWRGGM